MAPAPLVGGRAVLRRFKPDAAPDRRAIVLALVLAAAAPAVEGGAIYCYKLVVDRVLVPADLGALVWVGALFAALTLAGAVLAYAGETTLSRAAEGFVLRLRTRVFAHLQTLGPAVHDRRRLGDVLSRLTGDVDAIERLMVSGLADGLAYGLRVLVFGGALFVLQWRLALVALVAAPLFWIIARVFARRIKAASRERRRRSGVLGAVTQESLANVALVQAYEREAAETDRVREAAAGVRASELQLTRLREGLGALVDAAEMAGVLLVVAVGVHELGAGRITLGDLAAFLGFLTQLYSPVRRLSRLYASLHAAWAGAERVIELLDERPAVADGPCAIALPRATGNVSFEAVGFRYPGASREALRDVSLTVGRGETLALVGASGAGKSSVAKLLLRFYDPDAGAVRLDGHDLRDLRLADLRANVTLLAQETLMLHASVAENIAFGRAGASRADVVAAAVDADADAFIRAMPDGYDTVVGEHGRRLSGGQRQRLSIARALLRDAPVLVLDEPTTGLDAHSQARVLEPLRGLMRDRATILISHTLAAARGADRIAVLDGGEVVEAGTHAELLAAGGAYARLWARQAADGLATHDPEPVHA